MNINITILGQAISFIIFVLFCMKYLWPSLIFVIEKRQKEISDMFDSIEKEKNILEIKRIEITNYLEQAKIEAKLIVLRANQYKTQLIDQAKCDARVEREKILLQAYKEIDIKRKCISEKLQQEISSMVIFGIEKILEHPINKSVNRNIIDAVLTDLSHCRINENINRYREIV